MCSQKKKAFVADELVKLIHLYFLSLLLNFTVCILCRYIMIIKFFLITSSPKIRGTNVQNIS